MLVTRSDLPSSTSHKVRIILCFRPGRCRGDKAEHEDHAGGLPEIDQLRAALGHLGQDVAQVPANPSPPADIFVGHRTGVHAARSDRDEEAALHGFVHVVQQALVVSGVRHPSVFEDLYRVSGQPYLGLQTGPVRHRSEVIGHEGRAGCTAKIEAIGFRSGRKVTMARPPGATIEASRR